LPTPTVTRKEIIQYIIDVPPERCPWLHAKDCCRNPTDK